ncbi:MAG: hypothetical protein HY231_04820 [Acidobacteria bacterium]|nr:hypothetical protein [Acidobacteriota bacterium]
MMGDCQAANGATAIRCCTRKTVFHDVVTDSPVPVSAVDQPPDQACGAAAIFFRRRAAPPFWLQARWPLPSIKS